MPTAPLPVVVKFETARRGRRPRTVFFDRVELQALMGAYSVRVARGEWRDYAIDHRPGAAVFSIFRHSFERPLFGVSKSPAGGGRWVYEAFADRRLLKRSGVLADVLATFDAPLRLVR